MLNVQNSGTLVTNALYFLIHFSRLLNLNGTLPTPSPLLPTGPASLLLVLRLLTALLDYLNHPLDLICLPLAALPCAYSLGRRPSQTASQVYLGLGFYIHY